MKVEGLITWGIALLLMAVFLFIKKKIQNLFQTQVEEDLPIGFGYKIMWIAVKTEMKEKVGEIIGLKKLQPSTWKNGIDKAYKDSVFITPPVNGWTLAVGMKLPSGDSIESIDKVKLLLKKLSLEFGEAQFFCTHRVVEYHCWIKSTKGNIIRTYSYLGESGENILIDGTPTAIEKKYKLVNTFSPEAEKKDYFEQEDLVYPDEELVMTIAEDWSINPTLIDNMENIKGIGLIGK